MNTIKNQVQLIGNMGSDPQIKYISNGKMVATFSLAVNEPYVNQQGQKCENTNWFNIVCWEGLAKICEKYLKKGKYIAVSGRLAVRTWEDKEGRKHVITEIVAKDLLMLDKK